MRSLLLAAALVVGSAVISAAPARAGMTPVKPAAKSKSPAQYECTMDKIMTAKPGKCPICGMKLTKLTPAKAATAKYECKMDHLMNAKGGKCPKCGMKMTPLAKK